MAASSESQINLRTLQRVDTNIIEIIDTASQVAIYKYETKQGQWEGTDIEGTLFLYRRCVPPEHGIIIVNRLSTSNFIENITQCMQFKMQEPYLLYKNQSGEIIGSWFYELKDLKRIAKSIQSILSGREVVSRRRTCSESESSENVQNIALLSHNHKTFARQESHPVSTKDYNNMNAFPEKRLQNKFIALSFGKKSTRRVGSQEPNSTSFHPRYLPSSSLDNAQCSAFSSQCVLSHMNGNSQEAAAADCSVTGLVSKYKMQKIKLNPFNMELTGNFSKVKNCLAANLQDLPLPEDSIKIGSFSVKSRQLNERSTSMNISQAETLRQPAKKSVAGTTVSLSDGEKLLKMFALSKSNLASNHKVHSREESQVNSDDRNMNYDKNTYSDSLGSKTKTENKGLRCFSSCINKPGIRANGDVTVGRNTCSVEENALENSKRPPHFSFPANIFQSLNQRAFANGAGRHPVAREDVLEEESELNAGPVPPWQDLLMHDNEKKHSMSQLHPISEMHIKSMQSVLASHIERNSDAILQIHEAYISSLRSVFTKF